MIVDVVRLELRRSRGLLVWLTLTAFAYCAVVAGFYPAMVESMAIFDEFLKMVPEGLLRGFGVDASLVDPGVYYTSNIGIVLWPIVAAIAAVAIGTRIAADTDRGWIELPLAGRIPRVAYLLAGIAVQVVALAVIAVATVAGVVVGGAIVGAGFDAGRLALAGVAAWLWALPVAAVATLLAAVTLSRGLSAGVVAGVIIVMYLIRVIGEIDPGLGWLTGFSAFDYLYPTPIIDQGTFPVGEALLFAGIAVAGWIAAAWVFRRRDLVA
jgi:ABC-2 type transport system permease protein